MPKAECIPLHTWINNLETYFKSLQNGYLCSERGLPELPMMTARATPSPVACFHHGPAGGSPGPITDVLCLLFWALLLCSPAHPCSQGAPHLGLPGSFPCCPKGLSSILTASPRSSSFKKPLFSPISHSPEPPATPVTAAGPCPHCFSIHVTWQTVSPAGLMAAGAASFLPITVSSLSRDAPSVGGVEARLARVARVLPELRKPYQGRAGGGYRRLCSLLQAARPRVESGLPGQEVLVCSGVHTLGRPAVSLTYAPSPGPSHLHSCAGSWLLPLCAVNTLPLVKKNTLRWMKRRCRVTWAEAPGVATEQR